MQNSSVVAEPFNYRRPSIINYVITKRNDLLGLYPRLPLVAEAFGNYFKIIVAALVPYPSLFPYILLFK